MKQIIIPIDELFFTDTPQDDERTAEIKKGNPERVNPILVIELPESLSIPSSYKWAIVDGNRRAYVHNAHKDAQITALLLEQDQDIEEAKKMIYDKEHRLFRDNIQTIYELRESIWRHIHFEVEGKKPYTYRNYRQ